MHLDKYDICFYVLVILLLFTLLLYSRAYAESTTSYYSQPVPPNSVNTVGTTYDNVNGTMTTTYYNQYGSGIVANTYNQSSPASVNSQVHTGFPTGNK